jgi:hypothetical protein
MGDIGAEGGHKVRMVIESSCHYRIIIWCQKMALLLSGVIILIKIDFSHRLIIIHGGFGFLNEISLVCWLLHTTIENHLHWKHINGDLLAFMLYSQILFRVVRIRLIIFFFNAGI